MLKYLPPTQPLRSANGKFEATFTTQGNLLVRQLETNAVLWASQTKSEKPAAKLAVGIDRELAMYDADGKIIWTSGSQNHSMRPEESPYLELEDNGNFVYRFQSGDLIWDAKSKVSSISSC